MTLSNNAWPSSREWLGWSAEARDAHASRLEANPQLWSQQGDRVRALVVDWRAYRTANPPHPNWRENRAVLNRETTAFYASRTNQRKENS